MTPDEAARLAAQQLVTANRPERDLCNVVLAERWSEQAPRCPEKATRYVCTDAYDTGVISEGEFYPAERMARLCDTHEQQVRSRPDLGFHWSQPLAVRTDTDEF
jgi:hypothetical protein